MGMTMMGGGGGASSEVTSGGFTALATNAGGGSIKWLSANTPWEAKTSAPAAPAVLFAKTHPSRTAV
eukprot:821718-Prorocentrum_minimum.AAC.1